MGEGEENGIAGWRDAVNERTKTEASPPTVPVIAVLSEILEEYRGGQVVRYGVAETRSERWQRGRMRRFAKSPRTAWKSLIVE